jgi:transcription-repair coupling factor (superfamily II helicase)
LAKSKLEVCLQKIKQGIIPYWLYGLTQEAKSYAIALLSKELKGPFLFVFPGESEAENTYQDLLTLLSSDGKISLLPSPEKDLSGKRLKILHQLRKEDHILVVSSLDALRQKVPAASSLDEDCFLVKRGKKINRAILIKNLTEGGYEFSPLVQEKGDYSFRGGIVDFYSPLYSNPIRIELFGDTVESIREFNPETQTSVGEKKEVVLSSKDELALGKKASGKLCSLLEAFPSLTIILDEPGAIRDWLKVEAGPEDKGLKPILESPHLYLSTLPRKTPWMKPRESMSLSCSGLPSYQGHFDLLIQDIKSWRKRKYKIILLAPNRGQGERLKELFEEKDLEIPLKEEFSLYEDFPPLLISLGDLRRGFVLHEIKQVLITDEDIFKRYRERRQRWVGEEEKKIERWTKLRRGDYVVHIDHGIGKFRGIKTLKLQGRKCDYFQVNYKGTDRLYIPLDQLDRLHKYMGDSDHPPPIYSLEGGQWRLTKRRVRKAARDLASSLLRLYSIRKVISGHRFSADSDWQVEFEASFPYQETPDQLRATHEVKQDMESPSPMDRLVCGDAGYGKTEVAMRAAFKVVMDNKQVAMLVPTTILAEQHYRTFKERMAAYPIRIEMLCRFQGLKEQKDILTSLKNGAIDIVIGTHRLIQKDIEFKDLGLVIIDEEQRFGVVQKKRLRELRSSVDVLTLSATPIPRSLYMSLMGVRPMSMIFTPPQERLNVETRVADYDEPLIRRAIMEELERKGQVFYLYNRIERIYRVAEKIKVLVPQSKVAVAHGRMPSKQLEKVTRDFLERRYHVLACTSIIESGIDMPNVNTLIVEGAEQFGLADLYQLRGRVGRGRLRGYAYFLFTPAKLLTHEARKRLEVIGQFKEPGSGFRIAMQDLEIRGAGNLLGREQHGHIAAVGFTLYSELLSEETKKLQGEKVKPRLPISLDLKVEARIPSSYVPYQEQRFELYRRIGEIGNHEETLKLKEELQDRYGPLPPETHHLIDLLRVKLIAQKLGIVCLRSKGSKIWTTFSPFTPLNEDSRARIKRKLSPEVQPFPLDERNLIISKKGTGKELLVSLEKILQRLRDVLYSGQDVE